MKKILLTRRKKLSKPLNNKICCLAKDKTTSDIGKKNSSLINDFVKRKNTFNSKGKILSIILKQGLRYLNGLLDTLER